MNRKHIRLTESDLHRIVRETVNKVLKESEFDDGSQMMDELAKYITAYKSWSPREESKALRKIDFYRCGINYASEQIYDEMRDLAEDFASDNNLPQEWIDDIDFDELFFNLGK